VTGDVAGATFGNLRLVAPVDPARLPGTVAGVLRQFPQAGTPWQVECVGCGARKVTTPRWAAQGWVQCDNWSPGCRDAARWVRLAPSILQDECDYAPEQSRVWTVQHGRRDLHAELAAMRARVAG
jgi:hypothetical protein